MATEYLERPSQPRLAYEVFEPPGEHRGDVLAIVGFGEHRGRYQHVYQRWNEAGYRIVGYDLRGQGDSAGRPGHVDRFGDYVEDTLAVLARVRASHGFGPSGSVSIFGHSLGALIAIHTGLTAPGRFNGLALASPFLGLSLPAKRWQLVMARVATRIYPTLSQPTAIDARLLTHDPVKVREIEADPHTVRRVTTRWFTETQLAQHEAFARAKELALPVYCVAAGDDRIADVAATRRFFGRLGDDAELQVADGQFHELHQELERERFIADFARAFAAFGAKSS